MIFTRFWAMPSSETFSIKPIGEFVRRFLNSSKSSADPYARNNRWTTYTNDLNPETMAEYHLDALDFLKMLGEKGVKLDLLILDPPYSPRQIKECYDSIGRPMKTADAQNCSTRKKIREVADTLLVSGGHVLSFGWNSTGMGAGYAIEEIILVNHGSAHNDTICLAERKL